MKTSKSPVTVNQPERIYHIVERGHIVFTGTLAECRAYTNQNN